MNLIYSVSLQLWRDDHMQRFESYLLEHGVKFEVVEVAKTILANISAGKKDIKFGITACKEVVISISDVMHIKVVLSADECCLYSHREADVLISMVPLRDFNPDVFNLDLVQAYKYAGNKALF